MYLANLTTLNVRSYMIPWFNTLVNQTSYHLMRLEFLEIIFFSLSDSSRRVLPHSALRPRPPRLPEGRDRGGADGVEGRVMQEGHQGAKGGHAVQGGGHQGT